MSKNFVLALVASCALACAPAKTVVVTDPPKEEPKPAKPAPKAEPAAATTWSISVPDGWKKVVGPDPVEVGEIAQVIAGKKEFVLDKKPYTAVLGVKIGRIPRELADEFSGTLLDLEKNKSNVRILDERTIKVGAAEGVEWAEVRMVDKTVFAVLGLAAAKGDLGLFALCGADADGAEGILEECDTILQSIALK